MRNISNNKLERNHVTIEGHVVILTLWSDRLYIECSFKNRVQVFIVVR